MLITSSYSSQACENESTISISVLRCLSSGHGSLVSFRELYGNNLGGKIPEELGNLEELVSMDLYGNRLHGGIPRSFGKLSSLKFL